MATNFDLSEIPRLTKTSAAKQVQAAVRESQNAPRASYKPSACPTWWKAGRSVTLSCGSQLSVPPFGNPRDLTIDKLKAALHCYYACKLDIPIDTPNETAEIQESDGDGAQDSNSNDQVHDIEPVAEQQPIARPPPMKKRKKSDWEETEEPIIASSKTIPKEETRSRADCGIEDVGDPIVIDDDSERDFKSSIRGEKRVSEKCVSEELHKKRLAYLESLRSEYAAIESDFKNMVEKQKESTRRFVDDYRSNMNFTVTRLKTAYEVASVLPPEFLNMKLVDIVHKYGLDLDTWLHANVTRGVEVAMRYVGVNADSGEDGSRGDAADSEYGKNQDAPPWKTPPARTPAARRRRENIQDTVLWTARKVRMADDSSDVKIQQRSEATKVALASVLGGTGRITRSRTQAGPSTIGAPATPAPKIRKARNGEVVVTYSINGTPVRKSDGDRSAAKDTTATPVTSKGSNDAGSRIQALLSMADDIPKTIRQMADPEKHIAYLRRQLDEAEAELKRERC